MTQNTQGASRLAYPVTLIMLALAAAFPIALMVLNPTLMFERGWEQYAGTAIYFWAVLTLTLELRRLWRNEQAFVDAPGLLSAPERIDQNERRILPARLRQLLRREPGDAPPSTAQIVELNRESSGLDQEQAAGRFTLTRYILYLLPVIGFIGTVEGISKALMNISRVLPMVKDLDGFMGNLTSVTSALQIAFDSTLLALFLSASLMLVQTLVYRRAEDLLARVDRWIVEHVLARTGQESPELGLAEALTAQIEQLRLELAAQSERTTQAMDALSDRLGDGLGVQVDRFASAIDRLHPALDALRRGAEAIGRVGDDLDGIGQAEESLRKGVATLARIEATLALDNGLDTHLEPIRKGVDRTCTAIEGLSGQWSSAFERSSRATQDQLARTLNSLKDALDLLNVSMEQGNALYRSIVKKMFDDRSDSARAA